MYVIFFILIYSNLMQCKIVIKDSGVSALHNEDIGIVYYITLENICEIEYRVSTEMIECCLKISSNDTDCEIMQLLGEDVDILFPKSTKNVSLIYPNMYPYNNMGSCQISLKYLDPSRGGEATENVKIDFDTTLKGYGNCSSVDLDPLDSCEPVNCQMKYLGYRNYYNRVWKRCQKVPICIYDAQKDLPDVAYVPLSNVCRDLETNINQRDLENMENGSISTNDYGNDTVGPLSVNIRCHHGKLDATGFCVCSEGWISAPLDKMQYEPSLSLIHMCTIEANTWKSVNDYKLRKTALLVLIIALLITAAVLIIAICLHLMHKCIRAVEEQQFGALIKVPRKNFDGDSSDLDENGPICHCGDLEELTVSYGSSEEIKFQHIP